MNWDKYRPYFQATEFNCKCGCFTNNMTEHHMDMLLEARIDADIIFKINSGSRCKNHNFFVGGSDHSDHLSGEGSDIKCYSSRERWKLITALLKAGFKRIGIARTFIHAGSSESNTQEVIWYY
jgi:zinc D-Ala-D-Ala carboxypeptidase